MKKAFQNLSRCLVVVAFGLAGLAAHAETEEGIFVVSSDKEQSFALSAIKELTFSDEGMTVILTDETESVFPADWSFTFGDVTSSSVEAVMAAEPATTTEVYTLDGMRVLTATGAEVPSMKALPAGVYVVKCNGKSLKIKLK